MYVLCHRAERDLAHGALCVAAWCAPTREWRAGGARGARRAAAAGAPRAPAAGLRSAATGDITHATPTIICNATLVFYVDIDK